MRYYGVKDKGLGKAQNSNQARILSESPTNDVCTDTPEPLMLAYTTYGCKLT